jgi:hypothetical protein
MVMKDLHLPEAHPEIFGRVADRAAGEIPAGRRDHIENDGLA